VGSGCLGLSEHTLLAIRAHRFVVEKGRPAKPTRLLFTQIIHVALMHEKLSRDPAFSPLQTFCTIQPGISMPGGRQVRRRDNAELQRVGGCSNRGRIVNGTIGRFAALPCSETLVLPIMYNSHSGI